MFLLNVFPFGSWAHSLFLQESAALVWQGRRGERLCLAGQKVAWSWQIPFSYCRSFVPVPQSCPAGPGLTCAKYSNEARSMVIFKEHTHSSFSGSVSCFRPLCLGPWRCAILPAGSGATVDLMHGCRRELLVMAFPPYLSLQSSLI
jgi:hypothetical protein